MVLAHLELELSDAVPLETARSTNVYAMIHRRAAAADIETKIGNHTFRATGITAYLKNGGTLERAAVMANTPLQEARPSGALPVPLSLTDD